MNKLPDAHADHNHEHQPVITKSWRRCLVFGNAVIGAAEILTGFGAGGASVLSVAVDGTHNPADALTYNAQTDDALHGYEDEAKQYQKSYSQCPECSLV